MSIRHIVTIQVADGRAAEFAEAFGALRAQAKQDEDCEQYEMFQSFDDPLRLVILERWASEELLARHIEAERSRATGTAVVELWAPGSTPTVERFEV